MGCARCGGEHDYARAGATARSHPGDGGQSGRGRVCRAGAHGAGKTNQTSDRLPPRIQRGLQKLAVRQPAAAALRGAVHSFKFGPGLCGSEKRLANRLGRIRAAICIRGWRLWIVVAGSALDDPCGHWFCHAGRVEHS